MATSELEAVVRRRGDTAVIDLVGEVDGAAEAALDAAYAEATDSGATSVALNFAGAQYVNSTGIALIVGLLARARASRIELRAFGLSPHYREIFEITRLADFMPIADDEDGALTDHE
jgi:anti-anti-sigma factor